MAASENFGARAIVVGAGIIGSSIAWRWAQLGIQVTLMDAGSFGGEASGAAAGMLAPGGELFGASPFAALLMKSAGMYPAFVAELQEESGLPIDLRECGGFDLALNPTEETALLERAARQRSLGMRAERVRVEHLPEPVRSASIHAAVFYPDDAVVDPVHVLRALRSACLKRGVTIVEQQRVSRVVPHAGPVASSVSVGELQADCAVIAAGAWSGQIDVPGFDLPPVHPVKGHLIGYNLKPGVFDPIVRRNHVYIFQRSDGWTIAGASSEQVGFDRCVSREIGERLDADARTVLPSALDGANVAKLWMGFRPGTPDGAPVQRTLDGTNVLLAYGHYRNGILAAPAAAEWSVEEVRAILKEGVESR